MAAPNDDVEMEKIAEDELSKLQRQFRVMEIDRVLVTSNVQPTLRVQRTIIRNLNDELDKIMMELKLTKSTSNLLESARVREKLVSLLKEHETCSTEVREHKETIRELDFLLKQVQKEIKNLKSKGTGVELDMAKSLSNQTELSQLENRLNTAMKKFNSVNSDNYKMRSEIDRLLRDRQFFNLLWRNQIKRVMEGKSAILELLEQAIATYEQREEWCVKLHALHDRVALDYRKHCMEIRELQRQLDHSLKLEEFLRTKGTVRLTAADAKAEARKLEQQEEEMKAYNNYVNILDAIKEFTKEEDVDKLIQEFTRREEENYALFNYINEVNSELKHLSDNVKTLRSNIEEEHAKHQAQLHKQQDSVDSLRSALVVRRRAVDAGQDACERSQCVLDGLLKGVHTLAMSSECDSLPLLKLLGKTFDISPSNARLYIKSLEKKVLELVEVIKLDEQTYTRASSARGRRRRRPAPSPRAPASARPPASRPPESRPPASRPPASPLPRSPRAPPRNERRAVLA